MNEPKNHAARVPVLNHQAKQGLKDYLDVVEKNHKDIDAKILELAVLIPDFAPIVKAMAADPEATARQNQASRQRTRKAYVDGDWGPYLQDLQVQGERYAKMGVGYAAWLELIRVYTEFMPGLLEQAYGKDVPRLLAAVGGMHTVLYVTVEGIGLAYLNTKQEVIRNQEEAIRELSTPVLKVRERLLIVPVIGIVDTLRARQVTESMLQAIRSERARAVVIDITGVPMVDSKVANHLVQSVEAARLMGTTVIITGLSPEIAQTLVTLGAHLPNVHTFGDLQTGLEEAEAILGLRLVARRPEPEDAEA